MEIFFIAFWYVFCPFMCYQQAKKKGRNLILWPILGCLFGVFALAALAFKKNSDSQMSMTTIGGQAKGVLDKARYSANHLSQSAPYKIIKKIVDQLRGSFRGF